MIPTPRALALLFASVASVASAGEPADEVRPLDRVLLEQGADRSALRQITQHESRSAGHCAAVSGAQVVVYDDLVPARKQLLCDDAPNIASAPSHQNSQGQASRRILQNLELKALEALGEGIAGLLAAGQYLHRTERGCRIQGTCVICTDGPGIGPIGRF